MPGKRVLYNFFSLIHETGHGLGFKHPGNYSGIEDSLPYLPDSLDFRNYTVMSYNDWQPWYLDTSQNPKTDLSPLFLKPLWF